MGMKVSGLGQSSVWTQDPIVIPGFSINPTVALIGGGLLFIALFLIKGDPARREEKSAKQAERSELAKARAKLRELEERSHVW